MAIRVGHWDCPNCGHTGNLGPTNNCDSCGVARGKEIEFYLPNDARVVTDRAEIKKAKAGPDWRCEHCGGDNPAGAQNCDNCGAERGSSLHRKTRVFGLGGIPRSAKAAQVQTGGGIPEPRKRSTTSTPKHLTKTRLFTESVLYGTIGGVLVVALLILFFRSEERTLRVTGFAWERSVGIEELRTFTEDDWSVPPGGRVLSEREEIYDSTRVLDHHEPVEVPVRVQIGTRTYVCGSQDMGNGYFRDVECTEPVYETRTRTEQKPVYRNEPNYRTKYTYEIDRWVHGRTAQTQGTDQSPRWPTVNLLTRERQGDRDELYTVVFRDERGETYRETYTDDEWTTFVLNEEVVGVFNTFGQLREIQRSGSP